VVAVARFLFGVVTGEYRALDHFTAIEFYPTARFVTACLGVATVWLTARVGARWGRRESLIGALVMAVMPMHVRESHYALTDVPMTFLVTLTLLATLRAHERPTLWRFAQAGAAAGLAAATKYNGGLALLLPLLAVWPSWADAVTRARAYGLVVGTAAAAFLLTAPYTVLDLPTFLREFARLHSEYNRGVPPTPPWLVYAKHLRLNLGWPALTAALAGSALGVVRLVRPGDEGGRLRWLLLLAFPAVYFWMLSGRSLIFGRYLVPLVPMLCVLCGIALTVAWDAIAARGWQPAVARGVMAATLVGVIGVPAWRSAQFDVGLSAPSTRGLAYRWLIQNAPSNAGVAVEAGALRLPEHAFHTVQLVRIVDRPMSYYRESGVQYLVTSSDSFGSRRDHYREYFQGLSPVFMVTPGDKRVGPEIHIYALPREPRQ